MRADRSKSKSLQWLKASASVWIWVSVHAERVFILFIGNSRQQGWQRLHAPAVQHANVPITLPSLTHHGTGERCPEESRLCSRCTNKESVNDLNFSLSLGVFYKLCVSCHGFSAPHTPFVSTEKAVLIISIMPPPLICPSTSFSALEEKLQTGSSFHRGPLCLKHLNTTGGMRHQGVVWIHDTHSVALQDSNSQYTLCYNRNTGVIYPPCVIRPWLQLFCTPTG